MAEYVCAIQKLPAGACNSASFALAEEKRLTGQSSGAYFVFGRNVGFYINTARRVLLHDPI